MTKPGILGLPSGELSHSYGKSPFWMGKSTISMAIFNSYVKLPEGTTTTIEMRNLFSSLYIYIYIYMYVIPYSSVLDLKGANCGEDWYLSEWVRYLEDQNRNFSWDIISIGFWSSSVKPLFAVGTACCQWKCCKAGTFRCGNGKMPHGTVWTVPSLSTAGGSQLLRGEEWCSHFPQ